MKPYYVFVVSLALMAGCNKERPEETPPDEPSGKTGPIEYVVYVKYRPLVQPIAEIDEFDVVLPFDENDRMVVSGDGISGTLSYDRNHVYYGGYAFSGFLDYEGEGEPPRDLALSVRRVNASTSNDGVEITEPKFADNLEEAVSKYGIYSGTCTFGDPFTELSVSSSFLQLYLYAATSFPDSYGWKFHYMNNGKTYGPFTLTAEEGYINPVLVIPEGMELVGSMLELDGLAKFPVSSPLAPATLDPTALKPGYYYEDELFLYDLAKDSCFSSQRKIVIYQSDPQKPTANTIFISDHTYPPLADRTVFINDINLKSANVPMSMRVNTSLWVFGDCKIVSSSGYNPAVEMMEPYWLHILGDGSLTAENAGSDEGGAGISFGGFSRECGDLTIGGSVSIQAKGAPGAAGIGTGIVDVYYNTFPYCGDIIINTTGTVKATGGEGAPGIGIGRLRIWEDPYVVSIGSIVVSGGIVDAAGGGGEGVSDIGAPDGVDVRGGVSVDGSVTYDGVHGYHIARMKGDVPVGYDKSQ